jgi:predicted ATPase
MLPGQIAEYLGIDGSSDADSHISSSILSDKMRLISRTHSPILPLSREFYDLILSVSYLGPLRSPPERHYIISGGDRDSVGTRGERMPQLLHRRRHPIIPKVNEWFERFRIPYELDIKSVGDDLTGDIITVALTDRNRVAISPSDVGFGIGQFLPILVEGTVSLGKLICVEQPEIHLHPRMQAQIADFLIETAKVQRLSSSSRRPERQDVDVGGNQWIIETHSEALMLRIKRRIKEGMIPASFISVIYVEPTDHGSRVLTLRLDNKGDFIDEWPDGFFEEGFNEIFR